MAQGDEKIQEYFESKLKSSGYSLQTRVQNKLRENGYDVSREQPFIDKDESKGRSIDLIATKLVPERSKLKDGKKVLSELELVVECKNLPDHAWVFFEGDRKALPIFESRSLMQHLSDDPLQGMLPVHIFPQFLQAADYAEFFLDNKRNEGSQNIGEMPRVKSNNKDKNLFDAIQKVIKATTHRILEADRMFQAEMSFLPRVEDIVPFKIFQSMIIFQGHMYRADLVHGEDRLTKIKCVETQKKYVSPNYREEFGTVHIIAFDYLDEYLETLYSMASTRAPSIINKQAEYLEIIENHWRSAYPQYANKR